MTGGMTTMTDELVTKARQGGPCAEIRDQCRVMDAASGCFCAAVADRIEKAESEWRKYEAAWMTAEGKLADAEAERDKAYANGYSDAETEISKSALGQGNAFLHSQYANAADRIKALTAERDYTEGTNDTLIALNQSLTADNARLRGAMTGIKRAAAHRMQDDPKDLHSYYFHTAAAALNTGKEPSHE